MIRKWIAKRGCPFPLIRKGAGMSTVGIIANPASGKDIRRLVAYATVFDNIEKVNIVRRVLLGMEAVGVKRVLFMPDYFGIARQALDGLTGQDSLKMEVDYLDIPLTGGQEDSLAAAKLLAEYQVGCIVTLGGDGTNRIVAKGCGDIPLLPISTGTNNVFPTMIEGTIAGLAAGLVATGKVAREVATARMKKIVILLNGREADLALVDAVVLEEQFIGSRAIWDKGKIKKIVATRGEAANIGIASIVGGLHPLPPNDPHGIVVELGPAKTKVLAALGPGLIRTVSVVDYRLLNAGDTVAVDTAPCVIAVDGERELEVGLRDRVELQLRSDGPVVVDIKRTVDAAAQQGLFRLT